MTLQLIFFPQTLQLAVYSLFGIYLVATKTFNVHKTFMEKPSDD